MEKINVAELLKDYPKTYEECCDVFEDNFLNVICLSDDEKDLFYNIIKLKRCRDAYWRLYGEQMGLGKPWEPDWSDESERKYTIVVHDNQHCYANCKGACGFLTFPTAELRDAFYENFKDFIKKCKELLWKHS